MTAQTHQGGKFYLCTTPQETTLDQAGYEGLTYVEVPFVVEAPSFQITDNMLVENYLSSDIASKQKGFRQVEETSVVIGLDEDDAGHAAMIAAARTKSTYAIKYVIDNALLPAGDGRTIYARAKIGGGGTNGGAGEEFVRRTFMLGITDDFPLEVAATDGT